jgi:hypothetical protein
MEKMAAGLRAKLVEAAVPDDHVDVMVNKWVKAVEDCAGKKGDELDQCYKTATECQHGHGHGMSSAWKEVNWEMVKDIKIGFFDRAKTLQSAEQAPMLGQRFHDRLVQAGVPEEGVEKIVNKWVKAVEDCAGKKGDELDACYKTESDWHHGWKDNSAWKNVDWETVKAAKTRFYESAKSEQSAEAVRTLGADLRQSFLKAGVPEEHADSWVNKMVDGVVKDMDAASPAPKGVTDTECAKYEGRGELAVNGCSKCATYYPGRVDQCMTCGGVCGRKVCDQTNFGECVKTTPFIECHRSCMADDTIAPRHAKWLKLKRLFWGLYQKFLNLISDSNELLFISF